jgi:hypothetical protein
MTRLTLYDVVVVVVVVVVVGDVRFGVMFGA